MAFDKIAFYAVLTPVRPVTTYNAEMAFDKPLQYAIRALGISAYDELFQKILTSFLDQLKQHQRKNLTFGPA